MHFGTGELIVILLVVLLLFGANKLPQLGDALGRGIKNFKKAADELHAPLELAEGNKQAPARQRAAAGPGR
jgi:sec-independent protein translocase protein TatA